MMYCWPICRTLFVSQYRTSPLEKFMKKMVMTTGMIIIIHCWVGSAEVGVIFWLMYWVIPIRMGVT